MILFVGSFRGIFGYMEFGVGDDYETPLGLGSCLFSKLTTATDLKVQYR